MSITEHKRLYTVLKVISRKKAMTDYEVCGFKNFLKIFSIPVLYRYSLPSTSLIQIESLPSCLYNSKRLQKSPSASRIKFSATQVLIQLHFC